VARKAATYTPELAPPPLEAKIARLAERQHGVVGLDQLRELGISASGVRSRVAAGRLHRVHSGVYAVGHSLLSRRAHWTAAVLACGPGAVLSHRDAADLIGLRPCSRRRIDVTVRGRARRRRAGIDVHTSRHLDPADVTTVDGIPCTTVARTLVDLAEVLSRREVERAVERAEILRQFDLSALNAIRGRTPTRRGASMIASILREYTAEAPTKNELEKRFLSLCDDVGVPRPQVNVWVELPGGGVEVDFLWEREGLIVETDGWETHGTKVAFERDRERDIRLRLAEWNPVRITWRRIENARDAVGHEVRALLAQGRHR
jgi:predicted transcriptional regulator of viral defense system